MKTSTLKNLLRLLIIPLLAFALLGCQDSGDDLEEAGEATMDATEEAADTAMDAAEDAADKTMDVAEDAADSAADAVEDAAEEVDSEM